MKTQGLPHHLFDGRPVIGIYNPLVGAHPVQRAVFPTPCPPARNCRWVRALDTGKYPTGAVAANAGMDALSLHRSELHGGRNHELRPR